jgi:hypothetical protein
MKRSDLYIKLTTAVLFVAVAVYISASIYNSLQNVFVTMDAVAYAVEESFSAQGYVVRTETVIIEGGDAVIPVVDEGEKIAVGQLVAVEYLSREALETASEIRSLRIRIARLEFLGNEESTEAMGYESVLELSKAVQSGDLSRLDEVSLMIDTYIVKKDDILDDDIDALRARLAALERRTSGVRMLMAPRSGIFSQSSDGFEDIKPAALADILPSALEEMFAEPSGEVGSGKLITEFKWYFAGIMNADEAARLRVGREIPLHFSGAYHAQVPMTVESVGRREGDVCVVQFASDRSIHDIAPLRYLNAEIVYGVVSGIRVPKEAIHLGDDGATFIYLQTGVRAEHVDVEILLDVGDSYLVRDGLEAGTPLREGATIIVKANNLYHGKIVG